MRNVLKYAVEVDDQEHVIALPGAGRVVHVGEQDGHVVVWVEVTEGGGLGGTTLRLRVFGTGHPIPDVPDPYRHVGTAFVGPFVRHVYERSAT